MKKIHTIYEFLRYELWRHANQDLIGHRRLGIQVLKTLVIVVRGFVNKDLNMRANALTYSLLFAIVPILAMTLAVAKGFGVSDALQTYLDHSVLQDTNIVPTIMSFVEMYLQTASGGIFIGVGLLILLWAVYSFFRNIESNFNNIWNVTKNRSILRQMTVYISILFAVPLLLILSSGAHIFLDSIEQNRPWLSMMLHSFSGLMSFSQWVAVVLIFTWLYWAVPNTNVKFWSALIPAIIVGSLFQLLEALSVNILILLSRTSIVYGTFAAIPILLIWMQWLCLLILIGAELSFASQNNELFEYEHELDHISQRYQEFVTLYLLSTIIHQFEQDLPPLTAQELARTQHLPIRLVQSSLNRLTQVHILREVYAEDERTVKAYIPGLAIHRIHVSMVLNRLDSFGEEDFLRGASPQMQTFWKHFLELKNQHNSYEQVLVKDI